jgi:4-hydroxybenzoate polyprenyltransferase
MGDGLRTERRNASSTVAGLAYSLRPWQWYKQLIIFVPVAFSFQYFDAMDLTVWLRVVAGAVVFTFTAGAVYLLNDIADIEEDRKHPRKKHRPIASGQVSVPVAAGVAIPVIVAAPVAGWWIRPAFGGLLGVYVLQNILYSAGLKNLVFVDLMVIGVGFVLRAVAGVVLVDAPISPWLVLCTFLTALLLGIGKRQAELDPGGDDGSTRKSLSEYSVDLLRAMFVSVSSVLLVSYSLYTFFVRSNAMMLTIPFALFAVFRYGYLTIEKGMTRPQRLFLDGPMLANLIVWALVALTILYLLPTLPLEQFLTARTLGPVSSTAHFGCPC